MATVYSLICFGGKDGKTVTFGASNLVTLANHGAHDATGVQFSGGTLPTQNGGPTALAADTTYYTKSISISTFELYTEAALTNKILFNNDDAGTITVKSAYYVGLTDKSRWTNDAVECIYDGLKSWVTARAATSLPLDTEIIEFAPYIDWNVTNALTLAPNRAQLIIQPVSYAAGWWHNGTPPAATPSMTNLTGPVIGIGWAGNNNVLFTNGSNVRLRDITIFNNVTNATGIYMAATATFIDVINCLALGNNTSAGNTGIYSTGNGVRILNCIATHHLGNGFLINAYQNKCTLFANNFATKNGTGIACNAASAETGGLYQNNISVGNTTTNWGSSMPVSMQNGSGNNIGEKSGGAWTKGTPWYKTTDTGIEGSTAMFVDHTNNDFHTKASQTVTFTDAGDIVNLVAHGFADATPVRFSTSDALPPGMTAATLYYTKEGADADKFTIWVEAALTTQVTFTGTGSGTHKVISAPQVDAGVGVSSMDALDIIGAERPAYNNGATESWDCGPYEFSFGFTRPQTRNLVIPTLVSGSQVQIFTTATTTALTGSTENSGTSLTQDMGADMTVDVTVMKAGYHPIRIAGIVLDSTTYTLTVDQEIDRTYVASSGLTYTTNATITRATKVVAINTASTLQNFRNFCIEQWIDKGANGEALANLAFPFSVNGPNSVTFENGWVWEDWGGGGTGSASIAHLSRDGMRYLNTSGNVVKAWAAVYTPDTAAGLQVQIEQVNGGTIVAADNTGPMDQLVQIISDPNGDGNYADGYNYTGHMQLRVQAVGYTKPLSDVYATFGALEDQLYSIGLAPTLNYATTDADIDAANLALDNAAKTYTVTAAHTLAELYQRAQWWTNQDAQWDADVPLTTLDGATFTQPSTWDMVGVAYLTGGTLAGGSATLAAGTQGIGYSGTELTLGAEGTYTFTMAASLTVNVAPSGAGVHYVFGSGTFVGTLTVHNSNANACVVEVPAGTTTSSAGNTGGAITFEEPSVYQSVTVTGFVAGSRLQIYDLKYTFTVSGVTVDPTAGATYTNNGVTYTVISASIVAGSGTVVTRASSNPEASGTLTKATGTGDATLTFSAWAFSGTELFNGTASAGDTVISGSTCTWTDSSAAAAQRPIRLRVAKMSTVTAKEFIDANIGTCATSGSGKDVSYLVSQTDDAAYNASAIDGSTVTGITITTGPNRVRISIAGGAVTWPSIYAYQVYWQATATGIAQETAFIEAVDTANYLLTDFDIRNTHANPLTITGGWGRDATTLTVAGCIDSAGSTGNIYAEPDHVVAYATGSGLTAGQAAELTAAASSSSTAATQASTVATQVGTAGAGLTAIGDTRIANLDAAVSSRLATGGYTAPPSAATNASQVRTELTTELGRIDAAVSTRLASAGYSAPPSAATNASAVWASAIETLTAEEMMRIMLAALAGKRDGIGTATENYRGQDGVTARITLTPDANGNGTPVLDGTP